MSKYIKLEDAIRKYAEMFADEAYWEHGVGDGKPDEEDLDIAREYYSDLSTIEVSEDAISREEVYRAIIICGEVDNDLKHLYDVIENFPSVVPSRAEGEWIDKGDYAECSNCGAKSETQFNGVEPVPLKSKFCSNCGAKMCLE